MDINVENLKKELEAMIEQGIPLSSPAVVKKARELERWL